jgi:hypothetical protein
MPRLKMRMQGKSCLNFTDLAVEIVAGLARLTERSFERFRAGGLV